MQGTRYVACGNEFYESPSPRKVAFVKRIFYVMYGDGVVHDAPAPYPPKSLPIVRSLLRLPCVKGAGIEQSEMTEGLLFLLNIHSYKKIAAIGQFP